MEFAIGAAVIFLTCFILPKGVSLLDVICSLAIGLTACLFIYKICQWVGQFVISLF